jgi:general stress protein 26
MDEKEAKEIGLKLVSRSKVATFGTINEEGCPEVRAMLKSANEGLKTIWFSTNTPSRKVGQISADPRACVYFVDNARYTGLRLSGTAEIVRDETTKEQQWQPWFSNYYAGPDDPDYSLIRFTTVWGSLYSRFRNVKFEP